MPSERSPFWRAYNSWRRGGRKVGEDGVTCLFEATKPTFWARVNGMNLIVEEGDDDGEFIEVDAP